MEKAYAVNMTDLYDDMYTLCICKDRADAEEMVLAFAEQNVVDDLNETLSLMNYSPKQIFDLWRDERIKNNNFTTLEGYILNSCILTNYYYDCIEVPMF